MVDLADADLEVKIHLRRWAEVAEALRERKSPLPPNICAMLADKLDPDRRDKRGRRAAPWETAWRDRLLCVALGMARATIGTPGGPINEDDARDQVCRALGASDSTLRKALQCFPGVAEEHAKIAREVLKE